MSNELTLVTDGAEAYASFDEDTALCCEDLYIDKRKLSFVEDLKEVTKWVESKNNFLFVHATNPDAAFRAMYAGKWQLNTEEDKWLTEKRMLELTVPLAKQLRERGLMLPLHRPMSKELRRIAERQQELMGEHRKLDLELFSMD